MFIEGNSHVKIKQRVNPVCRRQPKLHQGSGSWCGELIAKERHRVEDDVFHIQTLNNYVSRWLGWMRKFHRVGTAYLANYLGWFRVTVQEPNTACSWMQDGANT